MDIIPHIKCSIGNELEGIRVEFLKGIQGQLLQILPEILKLIYNLLRVLTLGKDIYILINLRSDILSGIFQQLPHAYIQILFQGHHFKLPLPPYKLFLFCSKAYRSSLLIHEPWVYSTLALTVCLRDDKPLLVGGKRIYPVDILGVLGSQACLRQRILDLAFTDVSDALHASVHPDSHLLFKRLNDELLISGAQDIRKEFYRDPHLLYLIEEAVGLRVKGPTLVSLGLMKDRRQRRYICVHRKCP